MKSRCLKAGVMTSELGANSVETHLSQLFFTADRVYKLLKPVQLPFVDFTDTKSRCAAARQELELNRALSPDVYLGLADVVEQGELCDQMIVMRRLPADRELSRLLDEPGLGDRLRSVARHVAQIHERATPVVGVRAEMASLESVSSNWQDNFSAIGPFVGDVIDPSDYDEVESAVHSYLAGRGSLFASRSAQGRVRDGHGDLRCEHVYCLDDGPRLIDCVAFDERLRVGDVLADVAFLAMDLERLAGQDAAILFMRAWGEFTNEHHPSSLAHFFVAYRAHVRCKIACLQHGSGVAGAGEEAARYHDLALRHARYARVQLILVGGGPGTGKSTIAEAVAGHFGAAWLRSDEIRKDIVGLGHDEHAFAEPEEGAYRLEVSAQVQQEMRRQTQLLLSKGVSVVLDATWMAADDRAAMRDLAVSLGTTIAELRCVVPASVAKERISRRAASVYNPSDATADLVDYMAERFDDWPEASVIDTYAPVADSRTAAYEAVVHAMNPRRQHEHSLPNTSTRFVVDLDLLRYRILVN